MRLGLRGRILLLVLVALAPPTAVAFAVALEERDEAREDAQQDLLATAQLVRADVARLVDATAPFLTAVSRSAPSDRIAGAARNCSASSLAQPTGTARWQSQSRLAPSAAAPRGWASRGRWIRSAWRAGAGSARRRGRAASCSARSAGIL